MSEQCTPLVPCHAPGCQFCEPVQYLDSQEHDPTADLMREVYQQRLRREARRQLDAEERPPATMPDVLTLRERLARPRDPVTYRIDGWQPVGARIMLAAQFKAGKTTLVGNLVRALVDGDLFLGRHKVEQCAGALGVLDFEMSAAQLDAWLGDQRIRADDQVVVLPMRGNAAAFDILDPASRARWARLLADRGVSYLVLDCLRPVLDALGLDEHRDAGRFLVAFDALLREASVGEAAVVHHMGHAAERSRGDSRIRDWPDVEWRLVRQDDDPASPRYLSAYGRDVDQPEAALSFDPATRHLTITGGSRKDAAARAALPDVLDVLTAEPEQSGRRVEELVMDRSDHSRATIRAALKSAVRDGIVTTKRGPRGAVLHSSAPVRHSSPERTGEVVSECASAPIERRTHGAPSEQPSAPLAQWSAQGYET